jgi:hypothetical protein
VIIHRGENQREEYNMCDKKRKEFIDINEAQKVENIYRVTFKCGSNDFEEIQNSIESYDGTILKEEIEVEV